MTRCASCDRENGAEARFCSGCGAALAVSTRCSHCGALAISSQRFCGACGHGLPDGSGSKYLASPGSFAGLMAGAARPQAKMVEGERKQVTVLFADVKGSMDLSRSVDVEQWWTVMQEFFSLLCDGVNRFGGWVNQFTGDGVMAVFGAPSALEDHARRACHAALWLHGELAGYAEKLRREQDLSFAVRMGLNSGEVVAGTIGEELSIQYTTIGHAAGLAQRMESLAEPGGVYLTESTARLVRGFLTLNERGEMEVKGGGGPIRVFELTGEEEQRTAFAVSRARGLSPFVGRERELAALDDALGRALAGEGQVLALAAQAGVGKSRLCHEFLERCRRQGIDVWEGHALAHTSAVPFVPVLELLRSYLGITSSEEAAEAREKVVTRIRGFGVELGDSLVLLLDFLGIADPEHPPALLDPEARQRRLFSALNRLVRARSNLTPSVILVEDLHWIDPGSAAFLENLVEGVEGTRTLVLSTYRLSTAYRPEHRAQWGSRPYSHELRLQPLDRDTSRLLLGDLLGCDLSLDGLGELVYEHADGNPFFIEEIVNTLAESQTLEGERGAYKLTRTVGEVEIPETVESVLAARIDRLEEHEKSVLQMAAVIGRQFSASVLGRVAELSERDLAAGLAGLLAAELIFPGSGEGEYVHKHALGERVAYRSQLASRRAQRHAAVAEAIAEVHAEKLDELAALIAGHWERAGDSMQAAQWCARAAGWTAFKDPNEALRQWHRARVLLDAAVDSPERTELALITRVALLNLAWRLGVPEGDTREQYEHETAVMYEEAIMLVHETSNAAAHTLSLAAYGAVRGIGGHVQDMAELGMRAVELANEAGDPVLILSVLPCPLYGLFVLARYGAIIELAEEVTAGLAGDPAATRGLTLVCPYASLLLWQASAHAHSGSLPRAFAGFEHALALAREHGDFETESWVQMSIVESMELAGDRNAMHHAQEAQDLAERAGGAFALGLAWRYLGIAHLLREEWREAIDALERALGTWRPRRVGLEAEPHALTMMARAQLGLGDLEPAILTATNAIELARTLGAHGHELEAHLALAQALRARSGLDAADAIEDHLGRAGWLIVATGARTLQPRVHAELAELARLRGDESLRERELGEAHRLFCEVGAPILAQRVLGAGSGLPAGG